MHVTRYSERFTAWPTVDGVPCDAIGDGRGDVAGIRTCDHSRQWYWRDEAVGVTDVVKNLLDAITRCAEYAHDTIRAPLASKPDTEIMEFSVRCTRQAAAGGDDVNGPHAPLGREARRTWRAYRMHARVFSAIALLGGGPLSMMATAGLPFYDVRRYALVAARYDGRAERASSLLPTRVRPDTLAHEVMRCRGDGVFPRRSIAHSLFASWFERNYVLEGYEDASGIDAVWYDHLGQEGTHETDRWCRNFWIRQAGKHD